MHLRAVSERARGHTSIKNTYCTALAQIIVTVMEQFKLEVVAGSDYGKVSKNDTHTMIAKKVKETQRSFQSALLAYIKLIEILSALSPDMLPALRESYAEMVAEGIMMKKRMKVRVGVTSDTFVAHALFCPGLFPSAPWEEYSIHALLRQRPERLCSL